MYAGMLHAFPCAMGFELFFYCHLPLVMHFRGHAWSNGIFSVVIYLPEYTRTIFAYADFSFVLRLRSSPTKGTLSRLNSDLGITAKYYRSSLFLVRPMLSALRGALALSWEVHPRFDSFTLVKCVVYQSGIYQSLTCQIESE